MNKGKLATKILIAQMLILLIAGLALLVTARIVAPKLFAEHLKLAGQNSPELTAHAQQAFEFSFNVALGVGVGVAFIAGLILAWFLTQKVTRPIEQLSKVSKSVAAGNYDIEVPTNALGKELNDLSSSFQKMTDKLANTSKTRSQMLADLAHEIRTPLATLEAYIDGMEDNILKVDADSYETMRQQVFRLRRLTGDIKEASRASEHDLELVMSDLVIQEVVAEAVNAAEATYAAVGVNLTVEDQTTQTLSLQADKDRINQVLANLYSNALRHSTKGQTVQTKLENDKKTVTITIKDQGDGIPPEQLEAIFERFHRLDTARRTQDGGSGLGLTIALAIVSEHEGTLTATSEGVGKGAEFKIVLPILNLN